ncbi:MAG: hypothetical protein ACUVRS_00115 [Armatimonadota bacterium]
MNELRGLLGIHLFLTFLCVTCWAQERVYVSGYIGSHRITYDAISIAREAKFGIIAQADYVAITEIYPDTPEAVVYRYRVSGDGIGSYERCQKSLGFGPVTYFLRVRNGKLGTIRISNHLCNGSNARPILIRSIRPVTRDELETLLKRDRFTIMGLIPDGRPEQRESWLDLLARNLSGKCDYGIDIGFSSEIYYANRDTSNVKFQIEQCKALARKFRMPVLLGLVSWWAGTPIWVDDGNGGKFGDIKYQQICYSPDAETEEDPQLRALLGDRYNRHYGLSVPNQWSNCPWLTMNSRVLNEYRYRRLGEAVSHLKTVVGDDHTWVKGIFLENEPRYWDSDIDAGNPQSKRKIVWADFNPATVDAAARDGINLDPRDGLSNDELSWLHRNVGRYIQNTVDVLRRFFDKYSFNWDIPLYTHTLQLRNMFPGASINHPASEWGYANGARTGLEGMWSQPSDFYRVREWGQWCNLNREENDGRDIAIHLWDLRVAYLMGAELYNSYNWHAIGPERFFGYVRKFLEEFPVITTPVSEVRYVDRRTLKFRTLMDVQAFDRLEVMVKAKQDIEGSISIDIAFGNGDCASIQRQFVKMGPGMHKLAIEFPTLVEIPYDREATLVLYVFDSRSGVNPDAVEFVQESSQSMKLGLDLQLQRALSLYVIANASRGIEE